MRKSRAPQRAPCNAFRYPEPCVGRVAGAQQVCATDAAGIRYRKFREAGSNDILIAEVFANEIKVRGGKEAIASDLTYDLRSGDPDFIDQLVALTFGNMAFDAILDGKTGLMSDQMRLPPRHHVADAQRATAPRPFIRPTRTHIRPGRQSMAIKRISILTGGGDVPGLNSVIKSATYRSSENSIEIFGLRRGWEALTHLNFKEPTTQSHYVVTQCYGRRCPSYGISGARKPVSGRRRSPRLSPRSGRGDVPSRCA
jgi:6-phosphofructokinase